MMTMLKKQKISLYIYLLVFVLTTSLVFLYISNVNKAYYQDMQVNVLYLLAAALVFLLLTIGLSFHAKTKSLLMAADISRIVASLLIILGGVRFISMRLESFGYIFGSNLEMNNEAAIDAGSQAIMIIVIFVATWLISVIAAFFDIGQKKTVTE